MLWVSAGVDFVYHIKLTLKSFGCIAFSLHCIACTFTQEGMKLRCRLQMVKIERTRRGGLSNEMNECDVVWFCICLVFTVQSVSQTQSI